LDAFETLWRHRVRTSEDPKLLLHHRDAQWGIFGDLARNP
jgi:hypothetical protein